ncbi:MAG: DNA polymerase III subunit alpha [Bacteroidales bacterium]|nr:DNA polymerase III subunit alpha [Bacteroidales bacterium]MBN2817433.1 DNA polymerase III subunit alpha [Bacteroidales bacterium]
MFLNCHTYYSLRYGTLSPEKLVAKAVENKVEALVLTDINNSTGMPDFVKFCYKAGVKPIGGMEFRDDNHQPLYTAIAANNEGFREINEFLTWHNQNKATLPPCPPVFQYAISVYPFTGKLPRKLKETEFVGVRPHELRRLVTSPLKSEKHKLLAWHPVSFAHSGEYKIHQYLRAIDKNTLLTKLTVDDLARKDEHFLSRDFFQIAYDEHPHILRNTQKILSAFEMSFDYSTVKNKQVYSGSRYDDKLLLEKLACEGMQYRYGKNNKEAQRRIKHELEVIDKLGFSAYFLITWDIIRYTMSRGFYHVGRGSGANSIVAYCLRITDVDPIELDLYFERFINPKRSSPPDFDIDYSWRDRDDVQDYIFKRYGKNHTALLGTITTFKDKSIFRELGKVRGLPKEEIDNLVKNPEDTMNRSQITEELFEIGNSIVDFPNIRSIHAGGVLISELPLTYYTALDLPPKGLPTTQWDMYVAEDLRFEKLDILSQRGIGHINDTVELVKKNTGIKIDVHRVQDFKNDPELNKHLQEGEALGCFYIESPAMRGLLQKLRCNSYLSLVAASSIIRPGVAKSGMMKEYIHRFNNPDNFEYLHPVMKEQLEETFGVMVYQEDVIKICHHFAGLDLSDADILRRAMAGKFRSRVEFARIQNKFFDNCLERGYGQELIAEVWRQISSFAGYAFSKAHSASYAVESYQSLYLKTYHPHEFIVSVINNFGGFYQRWVYFNEARRLGADVLLPCVNRGEYLTSLTGKDIYIGFIHVQNLEIKLVNRFIEEREENGLFVDLYDFMKRTGITREQIIILIRLNALRFTGKTKKQLLWEAHMYLSSKKQLPQMKSLFTEKPREYKLPPLEQETLEDAYDELELIGFTVSMTMFDMLGTTFRGQVYARHLRDNVGKMVRILGNLVTIKYVRTVKKEWMHFGCFLDFEGEFFDCVNFPDSLKNYPYRGTGVYLILGKVVEEFGFPSIEVQKMAKLPFKKDPRY